MTVVSISLPDSLLRTVDHLVGTLDYAGRSELIRAALRDFVARELQGAPREGQRSATITLVYPEGHERRVADIRHDFNEIMRSMVHAHATANCVEVFMVQGRGARIREFTERLRAYRETRLVQVVYTDVEEAPQPKGP